jgi:hypothetical protein
MPGAPKPDQAEQLRVEVETAEELAELVASEENATPLAGDQSKVYLEGTSNRQCLQDDTKVYRQLSRQIWLFLE